MGGEHQRLQHIEAEQVQSVKGAGDRGPQSEESGVDQLQALRGHAHIGRDQRGELVQPGLRRRKLGHHGAIGGGQTRNCL